MITRVLLVLAAGSVACYASAEANAQSAALVTVPRIVETPLVAPSAAPAVARFRVTATRPGDTTSIAVATRTVERRLTSVNGIPAIQRVVSWVSPRGTVIDSTLCLAASLAPVSERSHQPTKTMSLNFDGAHVTGTVAPHDSAPHAVDMHTGVPVFNSTDTDLIVASLPLAAGYQAILPFFTYELGGIERDTVTVLRAEKVAMPDGERLAWVAQVGDPFVRITYWVDSATREILQSEIVRRRDGIVMRVTRF
jgi:hypothetical protein